MSEIHLGATAQTILQYLKTKPGTVFTVHEVCGAVERLPSEVRVEINFLGMVGLIEHGRSVGGSETCRVPR